MQGPQPGTDNCSILDQSVFEQPDDHSLSTDNYSVQIGINAHVSNETTSNHQSVHTSCPSIIYPSIITTPSIRKSVTVRVSTTSPDEISDLNRRKRKTVSSVELTPPPPSKKKRGRPKKLLELSPSSQPSKKEKRETQEERLELGSLMGCTHKSTFFNNDICKCICMLCNMAIMFI